MAKKKSSPKVSTLAAKVLSGAKKPTLADSKKLAASVLSQDEKRVSKLAIGVAYYLRGTYRC
ncbi:MAG: hypothetical protein ACU0CA_15250 [Paracoccaceae bacterium]